MRILFTALVGLTALIISGCVALAPFRTELPPSGIACTGVLDEDKACHPSVLETTKEYDLHFVEFTDQGLQYPVQQFCADQSCKGEGPGGLQLPAGAFQINNLVKQLNRAMDENPGRGMAIVVFVHGWKHNASYNDENLVNFRGLLRTAAAIEAQQQTGRKVVGIFVSWRGQSIDLEGPNNVTFWSRKTAAMHVAQGSSRELFARLRAFKCVHNAQGRKGDERDCNRPADAGTPVKVVLIGHSFGGLIVYNAVSGSLIESMTNAFDADPNEDAYWRFADLTVLINPAFEATRYSPLHRIAAGSAPYARYETPLLISVTSRGDWATGTFFPLGRFFNTIFQRNAPGGEEEQANRTTVGHMKDYLTHNLTTYADADGPPECRDWNPGPMETLTLAQFKQNLVYEQAVRQRFFCDNNDPASPQYKLKAANWTRRFCGGAQLEQTAGDPNVPIWNVSTDPSIIPDHSDITRKAFVDFFRQIYLDTVIPPRESCARALKAG